MTRQTMISTACYTILALASTSSAWTTTPLPTTNTRTTTRTTTSSTLYNTPDPKNPCWQDNYDSDDDCLSTTYSAHFVAEEWIKSMPCGKDADCLPENLSHPGTMGDGGVEKVDVMGYLNIRKAVPVGGGGSDVEDTAAP